MINFILTNLQSTINSAGLIFDIVGAFLVAHEIVSKFNDDKYESGIGSGPITGAPTNDPPVETYKFIIFERKRLDKMKLGLYCFIIGFSLQLASNWVFLLCSS